MQMDPLVQSDGHIVEEVRAGNIRKYALLVERHKDRAMTLACRFVGVREEAEELVQDAFLRAFKSLHQFRGDAKFSTWFYRILYNLCMSKLTRRKPKVEFLDVLDDRMMDDVLVDEEDLSALERLEELELENLLAEEIQKLPEKFKSAITLFYVQHMSYEEMSEVLDLPLGTVKTNLFRGRILLKQRVMQKIGEEIKSA